MIRSVDFVSYTVAKDLPARTDLAVVSITEPGMYEARLAKHQHLLRLEFFDSLHDPESPWDPMNESQARQIADFVRELHANENSFDVVVHCKAGISRSAAVALFVAAETDCSFPRNRFAGNANTHVLELLSHCHGLLLEVPRAIGQREQFAVQVLRDFSGSVIVTVTGKESGEVAQREGPIADEGRLIGIAIESIAGTDEPGLAANSQTWDNSL